MSNAGSDFSRVTVVLAVLAMAVACCLLTGCGERRNPDAPIIVHYWEKWTGFEADAMQATIDDFNHSQHRIKVIMLPVSNIDQKLMLATAGGTPPDLAGLSVPSIPVYAGKGALTPLNHYLAKAHLTESHYIPVFWNMCEYRGFMWALPSTPAATALFYNKALFRQAGLDPDKPPTSLSQLDQMAKQLTVVTVNRDGKTLTLRYPQLTRQEKRDKSFSIVQLGFTPAIPGWWRGMWGFWFGAHLWDGHDHITANGPANMRAYQWYQSFAKTYGAHNLQKFGSSVGTFASPQNPFLSGKVAMVLQGEWMQTFAAKFAPDLDYGAAPFPSVNPKKWPDVTVVDSDVLVIPRGAAHPDAAFVFMDYVQQQKNMEKLCIGQHKFTPLSHVSASFYRENPNPFLRLFVKLSKSPNAHHAPKLALWDEYCDNLRVATDQVYALDATPRSALAAVQQRIQLQFARDQYRWKLVKSARLEEWRQWNQPSHP